MKIAILSDIHGNHTALKAMLDEAKLLGVKRLFILGDIVGYYYHPDKVIQLLEEWQKDMIKGNHEVMLKTAMDDKNEAKIIRKKYGRGIDIAIKKLNKNCIDKLTKLPFTKKIIIDNISFLLCHGSPWDYNLYVYPDASEDVLNKCALSDYDFVFMGHTHHPFIYQKNGTSVINTGSIGQSRDVEGVASWVSVDTKNKTLIFHKTNYDTSSLIKEVKKIDSDISYLHKILSRLQNKLNEGVENKI